VKLRVVTPITTKGFMCADDFARIVRPDTVLSHVDLDHGPPSIESEFDEMLAAPETVAKIIEAERDGMDAVVINCMGDRGCWRGGRRFPSRSSVHVKPRCTSPRCLVTRSA
jgi:allantoin racemase